MSLPPVGGATRPQGRPLPLPRPPLGPPFAPPPIPRPPLAPPPLPRPRSACAARRPWAILARFPRCTVGGGLRVVDRYYTNLTGVVPLADRDKYWPLVTITDNGQSTLTDGYPI